MTKDHIRRWTWAAAVLFAAIGFAWVVIISQGTLASALAGGVICGLIPLFIGGSLLFAPPDSIRSPLRYMGRKPPTIAPSDEAGRANVKRKSGSKIRR